LVASSGLGHCMKKDCNVQSSRYDSQRGGIYDCVGNRITTDQYIGAAE